MPLIEPTLSLKRLLQNKLLQPGESAEVEIIFTWKNDKNNLGVKTNIAEIAEDYNQHNSKDIDSVLGNKADPYEKEQEDDDDFALVILSIKTGSFDFSVFKAFLSQDKMLANVVFLLAFVG